MRTRRANVFAHICIVFICGCACASPDDDDESDPSDDDVDDDADLDDDGVLPDDDVDDDTHDDDDPDDDDDDDTLPPCLEPLAPPIGYNDYEALWFVARLTDPNSPVLAVYAFFWADWFAVGGCSWSAVEAVLFLRDNDRGDAIAAGGKRPDWRFTQTPGLRYDMAAGDMIHAFVTPDDSGKWKLDIHADAFDVAVDLDIRHNLIWSTRYVSWFDAAVETRVEMDGDITNSDGQATLERWWNLGELNPGTGETDVIRGWWLYAPLHWENGDGLPASTLVWLWKGFAGETEITVRDDGVISIGDERVLIDTAEIDMDFPENDGAELNRYRVWGTLADGRLFEYEAALSRRYRDIYPDGWADFETADYVETHDFVEGSLVVDGEAFTGGGVQEWHVTRDNPLLAP